MQKPFDASTLNIIEPGKPKSIWHPQSEFMRQLEIDKLKLEIKPRKVNMMHSQVGMLADMAAPPEITKQLYVPFSGKGNKGGFVK